MKLCLHPIPAFIKHLSQFAFGGKGCGLQNSSNAEKKSCFGGVNYKDMTSGLMIPVIQTVLLIYSPLVLICFCLYPLPPQNVLFQLKAVQQLQLLSWVFIELCKMTCRELNNFAKF